MPAAKDPQPPEPTAAVPTEPQAVAWEYTAPFDSIYLHVPLTARAATATTPATVFAWPDGAPDDGRWRPTRKKPNQVPDNAGPMTGEE